VPPGRDSLMLAVAKHTTSFGSPMEELDFEWVRIDGLSTGQGPNEDLRGAPAESFPNRVQDRRLSLAHE
jgi:hypothetical protein